MLDLSKGSPSTQSLQTTYIVICKVIVRNFILNLVTLQNTELAESLQNHTRDSYGTVRNYEDNKKQLRSNVKTPGTKVVPRTERTCYLHGAEREETMHTMSTKTR